MLQLLINYGYWSVGDLDPCDWEGGGENRPRRRGDHGRGRTKYPPEVDSLPPGTPQRRKLSERAKRKEETERRR